MTPEELKQTQERLDRESRELRAQQDVASQPRKVHSYYNLHTAKPIAEFLGRWIEVGYRRARLDPRRLPGRPTFNTMNMKINQALQFIRNNPHEFREEIVDAAARCAVSRMPTEGLFEFTDKGPVQTVASFADALEVIEDGAVDQLRNDLMEWLEAPRELGDTFEREASLTEADEIFFKELLAQFDEEYVFVVNRAIIKVVRHNKE